MHSEKDVGFRPSQATPPVDGGGSPSVSAPTALVLVFLVCIAIAAVWVSTPDLHGRDSSAFLWVGDGILKGELPYVDRWDHKGPLIYVLSAIAILIGGVGNTGVFILRVCTLTATLLFLTASFRHRGALPMMAAVAVVVMAPYAVAVEGGNLTEEYYLALSSCGLYLLLGDLLGRATACRTLMAGGLAACGFLLRPNLIGFGAAFIVATVLSAVPNRTGTGRKVMSFVGGFAAVVISAVAVLWVFGILDDCFEAAVLYNLTYSRAVEFPDVASRLSMVFGSSVDRLLLTVASGSAAAAAILLVDDRRDFARLVGIVWCVEIALLAVSGRPYRHYLLPLLVPFGYSIGLLVERLRTRAVAVARHRIAVASIVLAITLVWVGVYFRIWRMDRSSLSHEVLVRQAIQEVIHHSLSGDAIVIWGAETVILLESDRDSLAPFFYSYPLLADTDALRDKRAEWFRNFEACTASLFIDTSRTNAAVPQLSVPPVRGVQRVRGSNDDQTVDRVERTLARCYSPVQGDPVWPWAVYRLNQVSP